MREKDSFVGQILIIGDSLGVIIPKKNLEFSGLEKGNIIKVWYEKKVEE